MSVVNVSDQSFKETVNQDGLVLVDFWAPWCGPCKIIGPILEELDSKSGLDLTIAKVNVDDNPETASQYGVMSIPTLKLFKNGVEVSTSVGLKRLEELTLWAKQYA